MATHFPDVPDNNDASELMENGLTFLNKAILEFDNDPKSSLVNFWNGVEILMKVPLVNHDWRLIVARSKGKQAVSRDEFLSGDFRSVGFAETCKLLKSELGISIDNKAQAFFETVQDHRNRIVHFYLDAVTVAELDVLRNEQADAWFALSRLITREWRKVFHRDQWSGVDKIHTSLLNSSKYYAAAKFRSLREELEASPHDYRICKVCSQASFLAIKDDNALVFTEDCKVCGQFERYILVRCSECHHESKLEEGDEPFLCKNCDHSQDRYSALDQGDSLPEDYLHSATPAGCCECEGYDTVCHYEKGYLCMQCLAYFDSLGCCEYCSYPSSYVPSYSSTGGCGFCDGHPETWDLRD